MEIDLGYGYRNYSMTMYVADITDNCVLGLEAVIDLSQGVSVVNGNSVKGKYTHVECTPVRIHEVRLVNDCHLFQTSLSRASVRIQTGDIQWVVVHARNNLPYLVPNT